MCVCTRSCMCIGIFITHRMQAFTHPLTIWNRVTQQAPASRIATEHPFALQSQKTKKENKKGRGTRCSRQLVALAAPAIQIVICDRAVESRVRTIHRDPCCDRVEYVHRFPLGQSAAPNLGSRTLFSMGGERVAWMSVRDFYFYASFSLFLWYLVLGLCST